ncbi:MAG: enoyl-CoA hydratase/isomerase family protein [Gammaproteobacteria bacterium]|nr:enoyl-CoA hydratase/isomerase family protein [Gammaproteobacteria bacterium]NNF61617.1 enoyl-CoA hydratase/isomerase family protein [Gammaproteobacteria bacterium]NNM21113.1 enoyl-CoA hydratase/isomerase family protein [Gammaproteobacteria bacterium]
MAESVLQNLDEHGVLTLVLNRPEVHNAFDDTQIALLTGLLLNADRDTKVRVIILTGSGDTFCAGGDISWMKKTASLDMGQNYEDALRLAELMSVLNSIGKPTIAKVNGPAYGGGVGLIACCDIAVASNDARFALSEVRLGLAPAVISPYVIAALGVRQSRRYMLTGEAFDAAHAERLGLLHETVAPEALNPHVEHLATLLLKGGPMAIRESKELIGMVSHTDRSSNQTISRRTAEIIAQIRVSPEGQEGLGAFLEKRKPSWQH